VSSLVANTGSTRCASFTVKAGPAGEFVGPCLVSGGNENSVLGDVLVPSNARADASYSARVSRRMRAGNDSLAMLVEPLPALASPPAGDPPGPEPLPAPAPLEPPTAELLPTPEPLPVPEPLPAWFEPPEGAASWAPGGRPDSPAEQALANATDSATHTVRQAPGAWHDRSSDR
jgi:hypothetical protein